MEGQPHPCDPVTCSDHLSSQRVFTEHGQVPRTCYVLGIQA